MDIWYIGGGGGGQSVMKITWCIGLTWIYGQMEEGWGQSVMKMIWCNGLLEIHAQLRGVGFFDQCRFICQIIYISCFASQKVFLYYIQKT